MKDPVLSAVNDMLDRAFKSVEKESRIAKKLRLEDELAAIHWDFIEASELVAAVTCGFKHRYLDAPRVRDCLDKLKEALEDADVNVREIPHELDEDPE